MTKNGYKKLAKGITKYEGTLIPYNISPSLPSGDLKIVSERSMSQVDWGSNVYVGVWDGSTELNGTYKASPYEGADSWQVTFKPDQTMNGWGFIIVDGKEPEDMSAWANGHMHIALKGTAKDIGINMESPSTTGSQKNHLCLRIRLQAGQPGILDQNPLDGLRGIDFSQVKAYLALSVPDTIFDAETFYQIDDVYWKTTAP